MQDMRPSWRDAPQTLSDEYLEQIRRECRAIDKMPPDIRQVAYDQDFWEAARLWNARRSRRF
jgi:hypothetical protein